MTVIQEKDFFSWPKIHLTSKLSIRWSQHLKPNYEPLTNTSMCFLPKGATWLYPHSLISLLPLLDLFLWDRLGEGQERMRSVSSSEHDPYRIDFLEEALAQQHCYRRHLSATQQAGAIPPTLDLGLERVNSSGIGEAVVHLALKIKFKTLHHSKSRTEHKPLTWCIFRPPLLLWLLTEMAWKEGTVSFGQKCKENATIREMQ